MAPSPEHDNEPKAPDKSDNKKSNTGVNKFNSTLFDIETSTSNDQKSKVSTLDDGQLKALLDEAITYKSPKDREGKSKIFKELLREAEEDERNARASSASGPKLARYYNTSYNTSKGHRGKSGRNHQPTVAEGPHGGSLQNLANPDLFETTTSYLNYGTGTGQSRNRRNTSGKKGTVSARQREGGSLPSNVNSTGGSRGFVSSFESHRTKMSVEMVPLNRSENGNNSTDLNLDKNKVGNRDFVIDLSEHIDPEETKSLLENDVLSHNYESVTTPYQHNDSNSQDQEMSTIVSKTRYSTRTSIDTAITFSQLNSTNSLETPLQLETNYNSVKSLVDNSNSSELKSDILSSSALKTTNKMINHTLLGKTTSNLGANKRFDENGNNVGTDSAKKTNKRKKTAKSERKVTTYIPESIAGHRSDIIEDIDQLVKYVESTNTEGTNSSGKRGSAKNSNQQRGRTTSGRSLNNKNNKQSENSSVKKSNSLEELSTSKLEDLVSTKGDRRSWGTEDGEQYYCKKIQHNQPEQYNNTEAVLLADSSIEMSDFQVVNKKKKSRKRRSETISGTSSAPSGGLPHENSSNSNSNNARNRRKSSCSMPVSDKSDSSDLDSVHSLPVSAKLNSNNNNNGNSNSNGNVNNSYAERVNVNVNVNINVTSNNQIITPPKESKIVNYNQNINNTDVTPFLNSVEHFPELTQCHRNSNNLITEKTNNHLFNNVINNVENINNSVSVNNENINVRKPVVIIPISNKEPLYEVSELTFGFEVNEQLLALDNIDNNLSESEVKTINNNNNVNTTLKTQQTQCNADNFTARFIAPKIIEINYNHDKIVSYVGTEWDKIVHQPGSKVKYYSGQ